METDTPRYSTEDPLEWRVHPARDRLGAALFAVAVMFALAYLAAELMGNAGWGLLAFLIVGLALHRFFLPSRYRVDEEGVTASGLWKTQRLGWAEIRRFLCDRRGGYLSRRANGSLLDVFRGMHLLFGENRDAVVARIRARMNREAAP